MLFLDIFKFVSYFIEAFGKHLGSRFSVFNGGPFGVSRCGICERSTKDDRDGWRPLVAADIGELEFDECSMPFSNDDDDAITWAAIWWAIECRFPLCCPFVTEDDEASVFFTFISAAFLSLRDCNRSINCTSSFIVGKRRTTIDSLSLRRVGPSISLSKLGTWKQGNKQSAMIIHVFLT